MKAAIYLIALELMITIAPWAEAQQRSNLPTCMESCRTLGWANRQKGIGACLENNSRAGRCRLLGPYNPSAKVA